MGLRHNETTNKMKLFKLTFYTIIICSILSCNRQNNSNKTENAVPNNDTTTSGIDQNQKEIQDQEKEVNFNNDTTLTGNDKFSYSDYTMKTIAKNSKHNFSMLHKKGRTLSVCCAQRPFAHLFGSLKKNDLLSNFDFLKDTVEVYESNNNQTINKYYFNESFIKTHFSTYHKTEVVVCAKIVDTNFVLNNTISIGMTKTDFLALMFDNKDISNLIGFDIINVGENELGELEYYYHFRNEELYKIIIDTDYDWVNKELN